MFTVDVLTISLFQDLSTVNDEKSGDRREVKDLQELINNNKKQEDGKQNNLNMILIQSFLWCKN